MEQFETRAFGDVTLVRANCLKFMPSIANGTVNFLFADMPYSIRGRKCTLNKWDIPIDLSQFWSLAKTVCHIKSAIIFTATQPFATVLISSNFAYFRHDLIWSKLRASGFANAKISPMRSHEHVLIFCKQKTVYNPQMTVGNPVVASRTVGGISTNWGIKPKSNGSSDRRYPLSVLSIKRDDMRNKSGHPTQKPVALLEWLIRTYTNDGDTILDPVAGSGTTAIAAMNVGKRKVICIEKDPTYFEVMTKRVADHQKALANAQA